METFIGIGVFLLLVWFFIYFKYFKERDGYAARRNLDIEDEVEIGDGEDTGDKEDTVYSVAPWGDDKNPGSLVSPWKTLQHAVDSLGPGQTLMIRAGTYHEYVSLKKSGSKQMPILIYVSVGEEAVLDGAGVGWKYGINFDFGVSFVILSGLKVKNFEGYGVALWGENQSIQLADLEVQSCGTGLRIISAADLLVEGCNFHNNSGPGLVVSPGPLKKARIEHTRSCHNEGPDLPDGFVLDSGEEVTVEKCTSEYNAGNGFSSKTSSTLFSACVARDNGGYGIWCHGQEYQLVNCVVAHNGRAAIALQGGGLHQLYNNLMIKCGLKGDYGLLADSTAGSPTRAQLVNNIFAYNYGGIYVGNSAVLEKEDYNIYWSREDAEISSGNRSYTRDEINGLVWFKESGKGEHSFCRDPLLVDPSRYDFRLAKNSPAIDRGATDCAPRTDFNGSARPQGRGIDIGPYESQEGSIIPPSAEITECPNYSSDVSGSLKFSLKWIGFMERGEVAAFNVQFKDGAGGNWQNWHTDTAEHEGVFLGVSGRTYYFRVRARDDLWNWGNWSGDRAAALPIDDRSPLIRYEGEWECVGCEEAYLNTLHHSACAGASASLRFTGTEAAWISTRGPDRGHALVFIDGVQQEAVDLYCELYQHRQAVFSTSLDGRPHTVRIEVAETKNEESTGYRVDLDGFAVKS